MIFLLVQSVVDSIMLEVGNEDGVGTRDGILKNNSAN